MKSLRWEHEVLEQRFAQTQQERDDLYRKFIKAINEVQQKTGFKNALLEKKLRVMEEAIERKVWPKYICLFTLFFYAVGNVHMQEHFTFQICRGTMFIVGVKC